MKEITIIIVLYQESFELVQKSLKNLLGYKVIIIDNDGNKNLKKKITDNFKISKYILNSKNVGFSKAYNYGVSLAETNYIMMINADTIINTENIQNLVSGYLKYKNILIASPTFYDSKGKLSYNGDVLPEKNLTPEILNIEGDTCVEMVLGACMFFKKSDFQKLNGLDENFFLYFEDSDLCRRVKNKKFAIIQIFNAKAFHEHGQIKVKNLYKGIFIRNYYMTLSELYYFHKINRHEEKLIKLKKKLFKYSFKIIIGIFLFKFKKTIYYISRVLAYLIFKKKFYKK